MTKPDAKPVTAASLFEDRFRAFYPPEQRADLAELVAARGRPIGLSAEVAPDFARSIAEACKAVAHHAPIALNTPDLQLDLSDASVHRFGVALDRVARDRLLAEPVREGEPSTLFHLVAHGALYVAACIVANHGARWSLRRPLWESCVVLESPAGVGELAPFHWILRALSDDEIDKAGLVSRYRHYVERPKLRVVDLAPIVRERADRAIPALKIVKYDTLHKLLRAHLPELRDLGRDFPAADELAALGLLELDFLLLADARLLLMHGRGKRGLHLLWLTQDGFSHAMLIPCTPGDPHSVTVEGDKLTIEFGFEGKRLKHEMLYWG